MTRRIVVLLVSLVLVGTAAACGDDDDVPSATGTSGSAPVATEATSAPPATTAATTASTAAPTTTAPAPTTTATPTTALGAALVMAQTTLVLEDTSRPTNEVPGQVAAAPTRALPTLVWYPSSSSTEGSPVAGGPYPLVVLSHGITANEHRWDAVAPVLVAAGYVVATPRFPETADVPDFAAFPQVVNQPLDVRFVIDGLLEANDDPASPLHGAIDPDAIGVGGHSLGAFTTLMLTYNTAFGDPRIKAAFAGSGAMFPVEGGTYDFAGTPPLLLVHGDVDATVGYQGSVDTFAAASAPKWFLTIQGGGHSTYLNAGDPGLAPVLDAVVGFYDRFLKGSPDGDARIERSEVPGLTTLQSAA
jgi:dienelactone hydrolase